MELKYLLLTQKEINRFQEKCGRYQFDQKMCHRVFG